MKELGGKTGVLVGLNLPSVGGGTEAVVQSLHGAIVWVRGETFKAESETADLWQPKWNENQTALAAAQHTQDRDTGPLEGAAAASRSLGIVEQPQGEGCCWLWKDRSKGCEEGDCGGKTPVEESWAAMEARRYCWVTHRGWRHHHSPSLPTASIRSWTTKRLARQTPEALNYRVGPHPGCPFSAWCTTDL